jgi:hypothetical protein
MPNYCNNKLRIEGPDEVLDQLAASVADSDCEFSFETIVPVGEGQNCVDIWGTSGGPYDLQVKRVPGELVFEFESSWSPPEEIVDVLAQNWRELIFELIYVEPGCGSFGSQYFKNGRQVHWLQAGAGAGASDGEMREFLESEWPELASKWWEEEVEEEEAAAAAA